MKRQIYLCALTLTFLLGGCSRQISEEEAREIALTHAGLISADVTFMKSEIEHDNGRKYYDIEFYVPDQQEYDYEIDVYNGEILEWDVEPLYNNVQ